MKKVLAGVCCMALVLSIAAGSLTAYAAQTDAETGAAVAVESSGETLDSKGLTYELHLYNWDHGNYATVTGFSQKVYAKRGNTNYDNDHTLNIPTEVEGNDGTKYTVTEVKINTWEDGKEALTFKKVTIPKAVRSVGSSFCGIESLEYVDFEEGSELSGMGEYLGFDGFKDCVNLKRIGLTGTDKLPENVSIIEKNTFSGCTSLKSIVLPATLGVVSQGAFYGCTSLESVVFETFKEGDNKGKSKLRGLGQFMYDGKGVFENCTSLKTVVLPTPIEDSYFIGERTFKNTAIESITIPNGVSGIDNEAFMNTPLKGINLPDSCTSVGRSAFAQTKLNENGLKTPDGKAYGIAFVCKTTVIDDNAFNSAEAFYPYEALDDRVNTTIAGYNNSNADTYAIENDMEFVSLGDWDPCKVTYKGDIDDDGETDLIDVARLQQYVNGWRDIKVNEDALDVNGDGEVDLLDVVRLTQKVNNWDVPIY